MTKLTFTPQEQRAATKACLSFGGLCVFPQKPKAIQAPYSHASFETPEPENMTVIERNLYAVDTVDHEWRKQFFADLPSYLSKYFADRYIAIFKKKGRTQANTYLRERMGGELQRRVSLVLYRYRQLPTYNKIKLMSEDEDVDQCDFDAAPKQGQLAFDLEKVEIKKPKSRLLAEMELDELKDMAFKISQIMNRRFNLLNTKYAGETEEEIDEGLLSIYEELAELTLSFGFVAPCKKKNPKTRKAQDVYGDIFRMLDEHFWLKRLKKARKIMREHLAIAMGQVSTRASAYCSYDCVREHQEQQRKNWEYIQNQILVDEETQEECSMEDMVLKSVSNPAIRRHELMTRTRGCENIAEEMELCGLFLTLTTPGKYHNSYQRGGFIPHWNGKSPRDAQVYLNGVWSRIRAKLGREEFRWFGIRVAEPHHDGTPHWHLLLWCKPEEKEAIIKIFIDYATEEDKHELMTTGVFDYSARCLVKPIDQEMGSATGYIAKYISKNIDGYAMDDEISDETGKPVKDMAKNVTAWKSRWCIRQFQFIGGAPVTTYRELRRLANLDKAAYMEILHSQKREALLATYRDMTANDMGPHLPNSMLSKSAIMKRLGDAYKPTIKHENNSVVQTMESADEGNWQGYIMGQGGPFVKRAELMVRNAYEEQLYSSRYAETVRKVEGIFAAGEFIKTRVRTWTIQNKVKKFDEHEAEALALDSSAAAPWSSVNNCTDDLQKDRQGLVSDKLSKILTPLGKKPESLDEHALNAFMKGSSLNLHDGRKVKIRSGYVDEDGNVRPPELMEIEEEPEDLRWLDFNGWPEPPNESKIDEYQQPNLSIFSEYEFGDNEWPLI
ncbi:replication endonuclease [Aliivibrio fischeri]|uniref:replication endonuclease n=1 Tax=Aliivibrio fischeri TaxID=668 RepID=UPI0012DA70D0|nr:replication endonuclease [Aliivibrio fischeri]MUK40980.1 replication endonuclease [Aliivibrio fischeri]